MYDDYEDYNDEANDPTPGTYNIDYTKETKHKDYNEEHGVIYRIWNTDGTATLYSIDTDEVKLSDMYPLLGENCRLAQSLPGTNYKMWVDEESKMSNEWQENINYEATQRWQDVAAETQGWQWLYDNYNGFVHNYDCVAYKAIEIIKGEVN